MVATGAMGQLGGQVAGEAAKEALRKLAEACGVLAAYWLGQEAFSGAQTQADVQTRTDQQQPRIFFHYGRHAKIAYIVANQVIPISDESVNPTRARHGSGVYITDVAPGSLTKAQIAHRLYGSPHRGNQAHVESWVAIDTRGLNVVFTGKTHIYRIPTVVALPINGKIVGVGVTP